MKRLTLILFSIFLFINFSGNAQRFKGKYKYETIGATVGVMNYFGDLNAGNNFYSLSMKTMGPALGVAYTKKLNPRLTGRGQLQVGTIYGNDAKTRRKGGDLYRNRRNLSFKNTIVELKADLVLDLYQNRRDVGKRTPWNYYMFAGVAAFYNNPKAKLNGKWVALQPLGTEGQNMPGVGVDGKYSRVGLAIPFGLGIRYKYKTFWDISLEAGMRYTFTDYLDDVSTNYVDKSRFESNSTAYWLSDRALEAATDEEKIVYKNGEYYVNGYGHDGEKRGSPNGNDWYWSCNFTLTYIIQPKYQSPKFR